MAQTLRLVAATPVIWADTTYAPSAANSLGTRTHQINMTGRGNNTAWQSNKADLGVNRYPLYGLAAAVELAATPTARNQIEMWLAWSHNANASEGNPGGVSGSDSAYTGYSSNLDNSILQLDGPYGMSVTVQVTPTIQIHTGIAIVVPKQRYVTLVVYNKSGAAFHSAVVSTAFRLAPPDYQSQTV